jgi:hypothetical protein
VTDTGFAPRFSVEAGLADDIAWLGRAADAPALYQDAPVRWQMVPGCHA